MFEFVEKKHYENNEINRIAKFFDKPPLSEKPTMYRQRLIPFEINDISKDNVIYRDNELIATKWNVINPKVEFQNGISFYLLNQKIKISVLFLENGNFVKYYCEVVDVQYNQEMDQYKFLDLLVDIDVFKNGKYEVRDEDELEVALNDKLITLEQKDEVLTILEKMIVMIKTQNIIPEWCIERVEKS